MRKLAREYGAGGVLLLFMPYTRRNYPDNAVLFTGYSVQPHGPLRFCLRDVTGHRRVVIWAFRITSLGWCEDAVTDVARYVARYSRRDFQPLPDYLKGFTGRSSVAASPRLAPPSSGGCTSSPR